MAEYKVKFLRSSHYAQRNIAIKFDKCVWFQNGLRYELMILVALLGEVFKTLMRKPRFIKEVKRMECKRMDKVKILVKRDVTNTTQDP